MTNDGDCGAVTLDLGPLFLYVLNVPNGLIHGVPASETVVVPVISRKSGVLLALQHWTLAVKAAPMDEEEDGSETLLPTPMVLDLVDFSLAVLPSQAPSFLADPVEAIPKSASLLTQAYEWLQMAEGHRINYYTAAEEEVPPLPTRQQKRQGPAILAEDPAPKKPWVKRVTAAALAEQVSHLVQVIPALTQQLEALQTPTDQVRGGGIRRYSQTQDSSISPAMLDFDGCDFKGSSGLLGAHRASASNKAASPLPPCKPNLLPSDKGYAAVARSTGIRHPCFPVAAPAVRGPQSSGQSCSKSGWVPGLWGGVRIKLFPFLGEKLLAGLAARKGNFVLKVAQNAARRLRPAEPLLEKLAKLQTR